MVRSTEYRVPSTVDFGVHCTMYNHREIDRKKFSEAPTSAKNSAQEYWSIDRLQKYIAYVKQIEVELSNEASR